MWHVAFRRDTTRFVSQLDFIDRCLIDVLRSPAMSEHPASDLFATVRSQRATVEALNRTANVRARIRATIEAIARAEAQIQEARQLLDSERIGSNR